MIAKAMSDELKLYNLLRTVYDIEADDKRMRNMIKVKREERGNYFDRLRKEYPLRREFVNKRNIKANLHLFLI